MEGNELRLLRNRLGLTQVELAQAVDVTANTVARWERGELRVSPSMVSRIKEIAVKGPSGSAITRPRGSVLDSHHRLILKGLEGHLDPEVFEACAVELVRKDGWSAIHVPGGKDDGFDGSVADGFGDPVLAAISSDVVGLEPPSMSFWPLSLIGSPTCFGSIWW